MVPIGVNDVAASGVLTLSSLAGCVTERRIPNTGILTTMVLAALSSNLPYVPSQHVLYDLCWSLFLPASLAFLLLSSPDKETEAAVDVGLASSSSSQDVIWDVSIPFLMASIGSIVGCLLSFLVCQSFPGLWLNPKDAALAACCLCASLIGGTVNFFATANFIGRGGSSTLMSSMAAADTFVMAVYFAGMALALKSKFLAQMFQRRHSTGIKENKVWSSEKKGGTDVQPLQTDDSNPKNEKLTQRLRATTFVTALVLAIVSIATRFEQLVYQLVHLPGTSCAAIAIISSSIQRALSKQSNVFASEMQTNARFLSEFTLQLFFAAIGKGANLGEALRHGPVCACFSLLALSMHSVIAFSGSIFAKRVFRLRLQLEDVLVASNAAVGGPATAAAFAGRMNASGRKRGLTIAGTVWGVVGYAVGTNIGVTLYSILQKYV